MPWNPSRRRFLTGAVGANLAMAIAPGWLRARAEGAEDPAVEQVLAGIFGVDMHNHVNALESGPQAASKDQGKSQSALDLAGEIKGSGLTAVCAAFRLDFNASDPYARFTRGLDAIDGLLAKGGLARALTLKDLQAAKDTKTPAFVQSIEGPISSKGNSAGWKRSTSEGSATCNCCTTRATRSRRSATSTPSPLQWVTLAMRPDKGDRHPARPVFSGVGGSNRAGSQSPLSSMVRKRSVNRCSLGGLTAFGSSVVKECNRLGIVVDLAHAAHETVLGALKVSTQPMIVSHTSLDTRAGKNARMAKMMAPRLISKEHARVIADAGGVIGVWTKLSDSLVEFVGGLKALADAAGVDHVGIGTDTNILSAQAGQSTNGAWPGLSGGFFRATVAEMLRQGFTPEEIGKIGGGNFCRVFDKVTGGRA